MPKPTEAEVLQMRADVAKASFELEEMDLLKVAAALRALQKHEGFTTPCEEFILNTLSSYAWKHMTPESVEKALEEFKQDLDMVGRAVDGYANQFPEMFRAKQQEIANAAH